MLSNNTFGVDESQLPTTTLPERTRRSLDTPDGEEAYYAWRNQAESEIQKEYPGYAIGSVIPCRTVFNLFEAGFEPAEVLAEARRLGQIRI